MAGITLIGISKSFGNTRVLDDINLEIAEGELLVILGPSGCGKSTLLRLIAGLEQLDSGAIYMGSKRIDQLQPKARNVAMVFQNYSLYPHMTVGKNLSFPLRVMGENRELIRERVNATAELLGLSEKLDSKPGQLSGGQRQRVALGRAIIRNPAIFLLDEPLSNLDADLRVRMRQEISRIQKKVNVTTIHVTHDQVEALTLADRIAVLHDGKLSQVGSPVELYESPANLFVAQFLGNAQLNVISSVIRNHKPMLFDNEIPIEINIQGATEILIGVRPEKIRISSEGFYHGIVEKCEYQGDQFVARLSVEGTIIRASALSQDLPVGKSVNFGIVPGDLLFFDPITNTRIEI